ncbi:MAG: DNA-processing protein DprA [Patescibacteria group bacterium]|jgi:DNA processing protein
MDDDCKKYLVGISLVEAVGAVRFKKIINHFSNPKDFFNATRAELLAAGIPVWVVDVILRQRTIVDVEKAWDLLQQEGIEVLTFWDQNYPDLLKQIYDWPPILYFRGSPEILRGKMLAVVGTRRPTEYGIRATQDIVSGLVAGGVSIVSGLARGIDSTAHKTVIGLDGKTVAVLGTGLDWRSIYPAENKRLVEEIIYCGGIVISEFPCGTPPNRQNFPRRNRLISGLSQGVLVVEAGQGSGALITARCALDQNRDVYAVPGNIYNVNSFGPNELICQGAKPVSSANDILEALDLSLIKETTRIKEAVASSKEEKTLLQFVSSEPVHIDNLIRQSELSSEVVNSVLLVMELAGKVKDVGGKRYVIN